MSQRYPFDFPRPLRVAFVVLVAGFLSVGMTGCDSAANYLKSERSLDMETQDFKDALAPREVETKDKASADADIPALNPYISAASGEITKSMPLVSVSVNQSVPIRDILFELARQAEFDIELDPRIRGSIIFTARDRPLDEVVDRIADMSGLRYKFDNGVLRIEIDEPYNKLYKLDYLSYIRTSKGNIRNDIAVVSGDGADTGSAFEATSESEADFWKELDANMSQLLGVPPSNLVTSTDPRIVATEPNPEAPVAAVGAPDANGNVQVQAPQAVLRVDALPVEDTGTEAASGAAVPASYVVNKQAGIISVYANERAHKEVDEYLKLLRKSVTAQVLIEAKILEVSLDDNHQTGIDWRAIGLQGDMRTLSFLSNGGSARLAAITSSSSAALSDTGTSFNVGVAGNDVEAFLTAISEFGTVKALASPRLTVLNNQPAVLNVATNQVFFEVDIDVTREGVNVQTDIDSEIRNVPVGVLVNVLPSINLDNNTISMAVRPTITRVSDVKPDPAIQFVSADLDDPIESNIPELNVQEIDTVIKVASGQPIVMGGLLQDRTDSSNVGVPILGEMPVVGSLFRQHGDTVSKTELVIFLQATILDSQDDSISPADKDLYRQFSQDRRPFKL